MTDSDISVALSETVKNAYNTRSPLNITGGGSKAFYGNETRGNKISTLEHSGITEYEASELVLTARSGTPLEQIEAALAANQQQLPFEPPRFNSDTTLGGAIAAGLSGPARPFSGAVRDYVLGVKLINGKGEILRFGGQVMKNVAGYDMSRLMAGSLGTLGLLLEISIKVLPEPEHETCLCLDLDAQSANTNLQQWIREGQPISASCYTGNKLHLRLGSTQHCIENAASSIGGDQVDMKIWQQLRDQQHDFFKKQNHLWRISVPPATPELGIEGDQLTEWAGAQRWVYTDETAERIREKSTAHKGHATLFRHAGEPADASIFHPLPPALMNLHQRIKHSIDPQRILNPGRLYVDL